MAARYQKGGVLLRRIRPDLLIEMLLLGINFKRTCIMPKLIEIWESSNTVKVAELIAKLEESPPETAVAYLWEGQVTPVVLDQVFLREDNDQVHGPVLLLNAET